MVQRVLFVYHTASIGGGSLCMLNIIKNHLKTGCIDPIVLIGSSGPLVEELHRLGVETILSKHLLAVPYNKSLVYPRTLKTYLKILLALRGLRLEIESVEHDILHVNSFMLSHALYASRRMKSYKIIHNRENWPKNENVLQFSIGRYMVKKYSNWIFSINNVSNDLLGLKEKASVVYDWVNIDAMHQSKSPPQHPTFLFLGGYQKIKGAFEVLSAWSKLDINENAKLIYVAPDLEKFFTKRMRLLSWVVGILGFTTKGAKIRSLVLNSRNINFVAQTKDVKSIYAEADCLLNFPTIPHANLTIVESLLAGLNVITVATEELREYTQREKGVIVLKEKSVGALAEAIKKYIDNPPCRCVDVTVLKSRFDEHNNYKKILEVYNDRI